jgi:predicted dehydrogenase
MNKKANEKTGQVSRRDFIKTSAAVSLAAMGVETNRIFAAGSDKIRIAVIGCGGRGNGAVKNCLEAGKHIGREIEVVATADWFESKAEKTGESHGVPKQRRFSGADAYKNLLETNADVVLMATSPNFRPVHFEAAIKAGKNVFMEKPVAVDPPGARRVIKAGELAKRKGLGVVAGTQRRHQAKYLRTQYAVEHGAIGKIRGGCVWWCGRIPWIHRRKPEHTDADYLVDNWLNFVEMSGDHIVEQHLHNLDVANWFIGHPPIRAIGFGGRARRETGNQYDLFSIQYDYADDLHIHSMCRQVSNCWNRIAEHFVGSRGSTFGDGSSMEAGKKIDIPEFAGHEDPYVQEHIDLLNSILEGKPLNEARNVAESTMTAIMGRISAYTGQAVRWSDVAENKKSQWYNLTLKPTAEDFETGNAVAPPDDVIPIPGSPYKPRR